METKSEQIKPRAFNQNEMASLVLNANSEIISCDKCYINMINNFVKSKLEALEPIDIDEDNDILENNNNNNNLSKNNINNNIINQPYHLTNIVEKNIINLSHKSSESFCFSSKFSKENDDEESMFSNNSSSASDSSFTLIQISSIKVTH